MAPRDLRSDGGFAMAALLVAMNVMAIMLSVALPVWRTASQREREAELVFRGEQYARAVELYQRKYAGAFPPNLDVLLNERMLRKRYTDPMTEDGEFQLLYAGQDAGQAGQIGRAGQQSAVNEPAGRTGGFARGAPQPNARGGALFGGPGVQGGILGVASKSTAASLREYNGRGRYNEWTFVATQANVQAGTGGDAPQPRPGAGPARGAGPGRGPATRGRGAGPAPGGVAPGQRPPNFPGVRGRGL
jgi:type II secretory pathway pseudopilin PulG